MDPIIEVWIQMEAWKALDHLPGTVIHRYVQDLGIAPFDVTMFLQEQVDRYVSATRRPEGCALHLDSTGSKQ